jgi:hypothetical protein
MNKNFRSFSAGFLFMPSLFVFLGIPALLFAQTVPAENNWGLDYEGKAVVAILPLAGEETEMIRLFQRGTLEAVAALGKYSPLDVNISTVIDEGLEIPSDMPPVRRLTAGARYALTGGVYLGNRAGEYYLQLWLWDMTGSTMIYTDDLVYDDIDGAMQSLPGLVEWLFSHIREIPLEIPETDAWPDPLFMLGFRAGLSQRWYTGPGEVSPGAWALNPEGGVSGAMRLNSLFSLQLEFLLSGDTLVYRGDNLRVNPPVMENEKYTNLSLAIPLLFKMNFRAGPARLSPLAGLYLTAPLGQTGYRSRSGKEDSYSWFFSVPLGITLGFEGAVKYGPGRIFAGLRYAGDFGNAIINSSPETKYGRQAFSLYLGYEFGFFEGKKLGRSL